MGLLWGKTKENKKDLLIYSSKSLFLLVRPGWLEHPTYGFVVRRSIQLSYGRVPLIPPFSHQGEKKGKEKEQPTTTKLVSSEKRTGKDG